MFSLIDMTTEQAQTAIVLCGGCAIQGATRSEVSEIAQLDVEHPSHIHMWGNCDDDVMPDRSCDLCGKTQAQTVREKMDAVNASLSSKRAAAERMRTIIRP